ncbi:MAG: type III polyketide synthase [Microbacterium sp.]|uniref:type III polyketide synthase n=1 Tax=unclassified Microbacterium TaxID=2609290 RepID=UPI0006A30602|nr:MULTISPECIES: type III polyketide synthase [unclassified Microbacterium]AKV85969.1 naringenin-chalcone synthase [Microbacterium sp. CGR1]CAH0175776.1 1,3,6,8-tetrahydroxynaphthalene synthase [Microbacterium sp. Bi98]
MTRAAVLRSLRTIVPDTVIEQHEVRDIFASQPDVGRLAQRIIGASFNGSGIDTRHTVIRELSPAAGTDDKMFFDRETGRLQSPGTAARNDLYTREASRLFVEVARSALDADPDIVAADVTHVITASCTGFHAPGPEYEIVRGLGLSDSVQRYHLGFMGCYASLPALRAASQFCAADPTAVVLVVSVELCTVHLRSSEDPDLIVANSLFADGAAAGIVTARDLATPVPAVRLDGFHTAIAAEGEKDMAWTIGDHGFEMILSTKVPQIIGETIIGAIRPLYAREGELAAAFDEGRVGERVEHWAIHPGGRSILDRVQERLNLSDDQLFPARETLRENGNMSSATVLFVIKRILDDGAGDGSRVAAMAFGPGLTAESALMTVTTGIS